jgi:hypothetical protein
VLTSRCNAGLGSDHLNPHAWRHGVCVARSRSPCCGCETASADWARHPGSIRKNVQGVAMPIGKGEVMKHACEVGGRGNRG